MKTITIEVEDPKDAEVFLFLAKRLECRVITVSTDKLSNRNRQAELNRLFQSIAKRGTLLEAIPDPVQWQKEVRTDRLLPGREV